MTRAVLSFVVRERLIVLLAFGLLATYGVASLREVPVDAIPDVGENQVIVFTEWPGRSPRDVEDQITYPLSVGLSAVPGADSVRGRSMFGFSFVQVTFEDGVDLYWARSRVAEHLTTVGSDLPDGVTPTLGPDATALGQVLYYTLDPPAGTTLADLRSVQDYTVKYALQSVDGVSEVASVGGYVRQYQVEVDPDKLRFHGVTLDQLIDAVKGANLDVGAKTIESSGMEFIVRGKGFIGRPGDPRAAVADIEQTLVASRDGVPVRVKNLAFVQLGPEFRRGAIDLNGTEAVGGVIVMRDGENPQAVIDRVKAKMAQLEPSLGGVKFHIVYDRTDLIRETIATLTTALWQELLITVAVILLFLLHVRASVVVAATLPTAVLMAFVAMRHFGVDANIMSLAGIAIAIGTMVDMGIIVSENVYQHLADWEAGGSPGGRRRRTEVITDAAAEVAPAVFTAVASTVLSFLPVFFLTGRDHKLFAPLAWTKSFALVASLIVAVLLVPTLCRMLLVSSRRTRTQGVLAGLALAGIVGATCWWMWGHRLAGEFGLGIPALTAVSAVIGFVSGYVLTRERVRPIDENLVSRLVNVVYAPVLRLCLRYKAPFLAVPAVIVVLGAGAYFGLDHVLSPVETGASRLGTDMDGVPGYADAKSAFPGLKGTDWIALDEGSWFYMPTLYPAASFSEAVRILQTQDALIRQIPEVKDVLGKVGRIDSALDPAPAAMVETYVMLRPPAEWRPGVTSRDVWDEITAVATLPGVTGASPLQPIAGRVVMLQSGIKASMAVRIYGDDQAGLADAARTVADHLRHHVPQVDATTVNPDIVLGKPYVEFDVDRAEAARYGMSVREVNRVIETALGGANLEVTVEGRERYPIRVRYERGRLTGIEELEDLPVVTPAGEAVPLKRLARMATRWGPGEINSQDARLIAHVMFNLTDDVGDLEGVAAVMQSLRAVPLPAGYEMEAVGSFQSQIEANERLAWIIPLVGLSILFLVYLQFRRVPITLAVFSGLPVAFAGGMIALAVAGVPVNTAVWVGFIALFGIAIDDGVVMATYLDQVFSRQRPNTIAAIREATVEAGLRRIRPCLMTTATTLIALVPVLVSTGRGADVARAMAVPIFGGMAVELVTLLVVPVVFCGYNEVKLRAGLSRFRRPVAANEATTSAATRDHLPGSTEQ